MNDGAGRANRKAGKPPRILVADDDPVSLRMLEKAMGTWGFDTVVTRDGTEAWKIFKKRNIRLAILDWMMPGADGVELCRKIRLLNKKTYTYVILITSRDQSADVVTGLESGADDYMTKPFDFMELRARIQTGLRIIELEDRLLEAKQKLYTLATKDHLTGLWNRAAILKFIGDGLSLGERARAPTSVIMLDVDRFKEINDTHKHAGGDRVLVEIVDLLQKEVRPYDKIGRYGGDEMLILLPRCGLKAAAAVAERIRTACEKKAVRLDGKKVPVSISLGVASTENRSEITLESLVHLGDKALYLAKEAGRNRVAFEKNSVQEKPLHGGKKT